MLARREDNGLLVRNGGSRIKGKRRQRKIERTAQIKVKKNQSRSNTGGVLAFESLPIIGEGNRIQRPRLNLEILEKRRFYKSKNIHKTEQEIGMEVWKEGTQAPIDRWGGRGSLDENNNLCIKKERDCSETQELAEGRG